MSGVQQRKRVQVSEEQARCAVGTCHAAFQSATPEQNIHQGSEADSFLTKVDLHRESPWQSPCQGDDLNFSIRIELHICTRRVHFGVLVDA